MGLRSWLARGGMRDPAPGVLRIVAVHAERDPTARWVLTHVDAVLTADGVPARAVSQPMMLRTAAWPADGAELPVVVDCRTVGRDRPAIRIAWEELPGAARGARAEAERLAAELRGECEDAPPADDRPAPARSARRWQVLGDPDRPLPGRPGGGASLEQSAELLRSGARANARVVSVVDVAVPDRMRRTPGGGAGLADLEFDVLREDGGTARRVRTRIAFSTPARRARIADVGAVLPVRLDPAHPDRIVVDVPALPGLDPPVPPGRP